jgi:hypothetical protein
MAGMARRPRLAKHPNPSSLVRLKTLGLGALLGFAWGSILWGVTSAFGQESGARGWAYIAITCAMIGGGVGGIFAAGQAKRRGERMTPKMRLPFRRRP